MRLVAPAVRLLARTERRGRRANLVALGLLAGLTAGLAIATLTGAVRTHTALDRLRATENAADAVVFPSQVGVYRPDWTGLADRPEVAEVARWGLVFGNEDPGGPPGIPTGPTLFFASMDGTWLGDLGRPLVVEGRMYDPTAADEVAISEDVSGVEVGDVLPFTAYGPDQEPGSGAATGAHIDLRVVGRVRTIDQFLFTGQVLLSPGVIAAHGDNMTILENADVRLRHGAADIPALQRSVNTLVASGTPLLDLHQAARRVDTTTDVEWAALLGLTAVVALAGLVLIGQAVAQSSASVVDDAPTLEAMGLTRRDLTRAATLTHLPTALAAGIVATATAVVASRWFPVGLAGQIEPDRGLRPLAVVLIPGAALAAAVLVGGVALAADLALRRARRPTTERVDGVLARFRRAAPLPVGLGTTMALSPGRGRSRVPVRQALVGAVAGIVGVAATLTLTAGLDDALDHPERAGVAWDLTVRPNPPDLGARGVSPELVGLVRSTDGVAQVAVVDRAVIDVDGVGVPTTTLRRARGSRIPDLGLVVTSGRAPTTAAEAAIGPATARSLGVGIGDRVRVGLDRHPVTLVGEALFPDDVHATFDEGLWLAPAGFDEAIPPPDPTAVDSVDRVVAVRVDPTVSGDAVQRALDTSVGNRVSELAPAPIPVELANLRNVRSLPTALAVFLALLAIGAVGHVLATSSRRRQHDFAVLRALGVTRRESRLMLNAQGTAIGVVGLVFGIPIGIVVGRVGWSTIAHTVPLAVVHPVAVVAVAVLVPIALLLANALAVWPGRRIARLRPAEVLRTE